MVLLNSMKKILLLLYLVLAGCKGGENQNSDIVEGDVMECTCPHTALLIQPYNSVTVEEAGKLKQELDRFLSKYVIIDSIVVLSPMQLPDTLKNDAKTRFRADKILGFQQAKIKEDVTIMGYIHEDVSLPYKGKSDWGVLGLSFMGQRNCVISTFRVRNSEQNLWKVAAHEFFHAFLGYPHCPEDNDNCIMKDAKGHPDFDVKNDLCDYCKTQI